jgi:hypothetical protein
MGSRFIEMENGAQSPTPDEHSAMSPKVELHYNVLDELIFIRKYINGKVFERSVTDPVITDYVVDRIVSYSKYTEV